MAKLVVPELIKHGKFEYPYIGISGVTLRPKLNEINRLPSTTRGVLVVDVIDGGPADVAGINGRDYIASAEGSELMVGGDVITAIEGIDVQSMSEIITYLLENNRPDDEVTLSVFRNQNGSEELLDEVRVRLGQRPESYEIRPS
jgi:S1-C subfamily serine protease